MTCFSCDKESKTMRGLIPLCNDCDFEISHRIMERKEAELRYILDELSERYR